MLPTKLEQAEALRNCYKMLHCQQVLQERYQLEEKLSENGARQTWLATDLKSSENCQVIVKLLGFDSQLQWENIKLFEREAQILKQLNHPRIPKYRDYFCINDRWLWFGLVQEYIPGASLKKLLEQGKIFTEQQILLIAVDVLNILIYLHELNPPVLHRDIKPSNLIWGEDEQVYLVDFGTVQAQTAPAGATFTVVGTYGYTPIEQFGGRAVPASDLYALGVTLIHLLTGIFPSDLPQRNLQIQFADQVSSSLSLVRWLQQLSEPALEQRFSTARRALLALESKQQLTSVNNSGQGDLFNILVPVPKEIRTWNWGAFLLAPFWFLSNRVWIGLLAWVPIVGFLMAIALGVKGNEWAWKSRRWESIQHFQMHQKGWAIAGFIFGLSINFVFWHLGTLLLLSILL